MPDLIQQMWWKDVETSMMSLGAIAIALVAVAIVVRREGRKTRKTV